MTDAEIVAYNTGVRLAQHAGTGEPDVDQVRAFLELDTDTRVPVALERLGTDLFWAWVQKGAWEAKAGAAR